MKNEEEKRLFGGITRAEIVFLDKALKSRPPKGWSVEEMFQAEIIGILRSRGIKTVLCDMNGRSALHGHKKRLMGADKGDPDFHIILPGKVIYVEVKTDKGKQSAEQKYVESLITELGHLYFLCRGIAGVAVLLDIVKESYT